MTDVMSCSICWRIFGGRQIDALNRGWVKIEERWFCRGCRRAGRV